MYLRHRPALPLAPYVDLLWGCDGYAAAHRYERVLPGGAFQLIIDLTPRSSPSVVVGMRTGSSMVETASMQSTLGVLFRPGGTRPFFGPPAHEFYNRTVPLDQVWGSAAGDLRDRLLEAGSLGARLRMLEAELQQRLGDPAGLHGAVRIALAQFARDPNAFAISAVARDGGLSRRRFSGLFGEQVGLTPKLYCRLRRFQQVVRAIASGTEIDWAQISLDGGYYDQAHMAHEFREFSGVSPGTWLASERPFTNHAVAG